MPYSDPARRAAYNQAWWRANGRAYRQSNPERLLPPMSRGQALRDDMEQARALADLEARHVGRATAQGRLDAYAKSERAWIAKTAYYTVDGENFDEPR